MDKIIKVSWDTGSYQIIVDKYFPCDEPKAKRLFRLMLADPEWTTDRLNELGWYFRNWVEFASAEMHQCLKELAKLQMQFSEYHTIPKRRTPAYRSYMYCRDQLRSYGVAVRKRERTIKKLNMNYELLQKIRGLA